MLSIDAIAHIALLAEDSVTVRIYATSKAFSFLKSSIRHIESERSFLIGSIIRCLIKSGHQDGQKILMALKTESTSKLREFYESPCSIDAHRIT